MAALTYIYLDPATSTTVLQTTTTYSTAIGSDKSHIGTAQNQTITASFVPNQGGGKALIDGEQIGAISILAGNIAAATITGTQIAASISLTTPTVTGGTIQTDADSTTGIKMDSTSLRGYDGSNNITFQLVQSSGLVTMRGATILQQFEAGENLTADDLVTNGQVTSTEFAGPTFVPHDTQIDVDNATTNFGSDTSMTTETNGSSTVTQYILVRVLTGHSTYPVQFNRVFLRLRVTSGTSEALVIRAITGSWNEGTVTWDTAPTVATGATKFQIDITTPGSAGYMDIDITSIYCAWDSGELTNNGLRINVTGATKSVTMSTSEATGGNQAILKIRGLTDTDKVYQATNTYPLHLFATIGFVDATVTSGNTADINVSPVIEGLTGLTAGSAYYIGTGGGISDSPNGLTNIFRIGYAIDTTTLRFDKGPQTIIRTRNWRQGGAHEGDNAPEGTGSPSLSGEDEYDAICFGVPIRELSIEAFAQNGTNEAHCIGTVQIASTEECINRRIVSGSPSSITRNTSFILQLTHASDTAEMDIKHMGASYVVMIWDGLQNGSNDYQNVFWKYTAVV